MSNSFGSDKPLKSKRLIMEYRAYCGLHTSPDWVQANHNQIRNTKGSLIQLNPEPGVHETNSIKVFFFLKKWISRNLQIIEG